MRNRGLVISGGVFHRQKNVQWDVKHHVQAIYHGAIQGTFLDQGIGDVVDMYAIHNAIEPLFISSPVRE
jgi:hypothetical protein